MPIDEQVSNVMLARTIRNTRPPGRVQLKVVAYCSQHVLRFESYGKRS